jgi:NADH-quinone oxidoreductase subunit L
MRIDWDIRILQDSLFWIPLLPLLGALIIGLFGKRLGKGNVALIGCSTVGGSAILAALILVPMAFGKVFGPEPLAIGDNLGVWFKAGSFTAHASLLVDHLNAVLAMVVTGVGFLIHVYSTAYMAEDEGFHKFFAYLNLFVGFMLILVLANNVVLMFVGWEGVGLCSYLLIGFWYDDDQKASAGRKAFVVNRIGDFGFVLGVFTLFALFGSTDINDMAGLGRTLAGGASGITAAKLGAVVPSGVLHALNLTYGQALTMACLLLFVGATGKSAQFPLYVWLPDAMAGPTPVSALIHAATMVTAGVYMIARLSFVFALAPDAMYVVASVGAFTALFAALMGFAQNDIKKVLAYSTVSQLGFMVMGVGIGAYWQAVFHLVTHAFFKACLFLGAGSVILGCHHEQDIRKMGGLRKKMPKTWLTFTVATLAITGFLPLSGFFSKDAILHFAHGASLVGHPDVGRIIFYVGSAAALGTAFYMTRLYFLVFEGEPRSHASEHAHEQGFAVTFPLQVLAFLSVVALIWGWPWSPFALEVPPGSGRTMTIFEEFTRVPLAGAKRGLEMVHSAAAVAAGEAGHGEAAAGAAHALAEAAGHGAAAAHEGGHEGGLLGAFFVAWLIAALGTGVAFVLYGRGAIKQLEPFFETGFGRRLYALFANKFYVDEIYEAVIVAPFKGAAHYVWKVVDVFAIDTVLVRGVARAVNLSGAALRYVQNGDVQRYAAVMAIGAVLVIWAMSA